MEHSERKIRSIYPLSDGARDKLLQSLAPKTFPKGHILFRSGRVEPGVYFIEKGIARAYTLPKGKDMTFWIGAEGDVLFSYKSFISQKPGYENLELLEDSLLYKVETERLQELFREDLELANWGRKMAELELMKTEEHFIGMRFRTGRERYLDLLRNRPDILRRVPLMHVASYLGITQVTLSRIRASL